MKALGQSVRKLRRGKKLTISGLHYETRIGYQTLSEIEHGNGNPRLETLLTICKALEVTPSRLFALADSRL